MQLILDIEATTKFKGDPFCPDNKLVLVGLQWDNNTEIHVIEHNDCLEPYKKKLDRIQELINQAEYLIGFNIKFDIHWLRRYGIEIPLNVKIWDCQLAFHIDYDQNPPVEKLGFPSLNDACKAYNLGQKDETIKEEYWNKGIDSVDIPLVVFDPYLRQDLLLTRSCKVFQCNKISKTKIRLIELQGLDLLTLEEMEYNGLLYDKQVSRDLAAKNADRIAAIDRELYNLFPFNFINWSSNDHKSVILYGGVIEEEINEPFTKKDGTVSDKRTVRRKISHPFTKLVEPARGSELKKKGFYATDEGTFKKLKAKGKAKKIIDLWLERTRLSKENGTYFEGIPNLMDERGWGNYIHGSLNTCRAITGRLSSSNPNLQNNPEPINNVFRSRYS